MNFDRLVMWGTRAGPWVIAAMLNAGCVPAEPSRAPAGPDAASALQAPVRESARIFISGHSLTGPPLPSDLEAIARSLHTPAWLNYQHLYGSSMMERTRGADGSGSGHSQGVNREGQGMNVLAELRAPRTVPGPYDVLLVTERVDLGWTLLHEQAVPALRHLHERLMEANPGAQTYFYEPWSEIDAQQPAAWIAFQREFSPLWQCLASRVNVSLQAEGRRDRILTVPASRALAQLVERALAPEGLAGLTQAHPQDTVAMLFGDRIHLTRLGTYYMALANYAAIYRRSPVGAWAPEGVSAEQAASLQTVAASFVDAAQAPQPGLAACRAQWQQLCGEYWNQWAGRQEGVLSGMRARRYAWQCRRQLSAENSENPLYFDPKTDMSVWWPAPQFAPGDRP